MGIKGHVRKEIRTQALGSGLRLGLPGKANDQQLADLQRRKRAKQRGGRQRSWVTDAGPGNKGRSQALPDISYLQRHWSRKHAHPLARATHCLTHGIPG